ncbi:hypothetical protein XNC1_0935 [Xenorhabdus nematophila ATCC 19061]|uniref:Uncharacterized protein n=1 Tax=Xenorhabdus nematophila (strain ATCC 19061 / DSM 3370 / CCUG 14189 / LMG 1036 / NCIMB 9965 / AN6) TaxID=406817 RepID=D3VL47_XENNA|nr:hypothetical protein XNC1_0935 [Xenorhabdus nematophila ATCC 19061]
MNPNILLKYVINFPMLHTPVAGIEGYANALRVNRKGGKVRGKKLNRLCLAF